MAGKTMSYQKWQGLEQSARMDLKISVEAEDSGEEREDTSTTGEKELKVKPQHSGRCMND